VQRIRKVPNPGRLDPEFGYVTNVYTCPEARNQGTGAGLIRHIQDWAREQRLEMLILWPSERSGDFYRRAGFRPSSEALEWDVSE
jgi:GNAT superfamily N-acetyltransferase